MLDIATQKTSRYSLFLTLFILFQPLLDLLTTFSLLVLKSSITPGILIRFLVALTSVIYLILMKKNEKNRLFLIYLLSLGVILSLNLLITYLFKDLYILSEEVKSVAKISYYVIMLLAYITAFKELQLANKLNNYFPKVIIYATILVNLVMIIANLTSTSVSSYMYMKAGQSGWFYAGNELGSLLAIAFPVVLWYTLKKSSQLKKLYFWIPTLLTVYSLLIIGTKVGYGAIILTLPIAFLTIFIEIYFNKQYNLKMYILNASITLALFIGVLIITPMISVSTNTTIHLDYLAEQKTITEVDSSSENIQEAAVEAEVPSSPDIPADKDTELNELIYSGRTVYLAQYKTFFKEANLSQKAFGMGYGGNYKDQPKTIEMDFYDIFYQFGFIGAFVLLLPLLYYGFNLIKVMWANKKMILQLKYILILASLAIALGIAYIAGHILTAPAVSIYFVSILAYLIVELNLD
ncbi:O-antigen ligase family protein [Carnobacterium maltaromaticum]|uniref:O-antigen ligase family protein n=1 Tax=Carnobacterium maltaromaticum TaxID=2751 RepID=UPI00165B3DB0|nr:O-antigen ligase family protein [Carnobacterium maltaromaticum]MBC9787783.1 hypothetical protein [Carnobacterium maltaromaticum]